MSQKTYKNMSSARATNDEEVINNIFNKLEKELDFDHSDLINEIQGTA